MFKVMIRDTMSPLAKEILEATGKIEVVAEQVTFKVDDLEPVASE